MIRVITIWILFAQIIAGGGHRKIFSGGGGCTAPSYTYEWPVYGTVTCNGGASCTNGANLDKVVDAIDSNNVTQATSARRPVYNTSQINGLPAATFNGGTQAMNLTSTISGGTTSMSYYAVVSPTTGTNIGIVGSASNTGGIEWRINTSGHQELLIGNVVSIGSGTTVFSSGTWITIAVTYNTSTGAFNFYKCSGGSCTSDGSGTNAQSPSVAVDSWGMSDGGFDPFNGKIAEVAALTGSQNVTGLGAYSSCKFGI